eukprot:TRINITY_DN25749_c0_g1_i1.p1 TRINITY_DN25749_c0_g1~~TRINITY_DN25749_c0_g1_i1.p1  ORF type:complete len:581 (+),score=119.07 TRINITY_DN25749_c0_g1_i1:588-2330(+)
MGQPDAARPAHCSRQARLLAPSAPRGRKPAGAAGVDEGLRRRPAAWRRRAGRSSSSSSRSAGLAARLRRAAALLRFGGCCCLACWCVGAAAAEAAGVGRSGRRDLLDGNPFLDQNPSCWTDGYTYQRCCVEDGVANDCWGEEATTPHSYERCCTSPCGAKLRGRLEEEAQRRCGDKARWNATLVTGLWNLRRDTWASHVRYKEGAGRAYGRYLEWLDAGLLRKRQALVLFLDHEAAVYAAAKRAAYGLERLTCLLEVEQEELPQMRWRSEYIAAHAENVRRLPNDTQPEVTRPDYTLVVNSKPELLACAALLNPFKSQSFAWVDAGAGRKQHFPGGAAIVAPPTCDPWALCVARRMWLFFDFRSKIKRLEHGSTFDSTVLLGGQEGVLLYALWFQWAISRYLAENVMDDEQSVIAEVWWAGYMKVNSFFGMGWMDAISELLPYAHDAYGDTGASAREAAAQNEPVLAYRNIAQTMGRWFGGSPFLIWQNTGNLWVPSAYNLMIVEATPVGQIDDDGLERIAYGLWCLNKKYEYYANFCESYYRRVPQTRIEGWENLPMVTSGMRMVYPDGQVDGGAMAGG